MNILSLLFWPMKHVIFGMSFNWLTLLSGGIYQPKGDGGDSGGGGSAVSQVSIPSFYEDPYYGKSQKKLFNFGSKGLEGEFPDYYKIIGEYDSKQFEDLLGLVQRDTARSVDEQLVRQNISRSGLGASVLAKTMGDVTKQARYADFMRAIEGRKGLLNTSVGTVEGVRAGALTNQGQRNQFNLGATGLRLNQAGAIDAASQNSQNLFSELLSAGLSTAGTIAGAYYGGPTGAVTGYKLGSAAGSAITGSGGYNTSISASQDPLAKYYGMI